MLLGGWRIEVSPSSPQQEDVFLHLIQAADKGLESMCEASLVETPGQCGVRFQTGGAAATVTFATQGSPAGRIQLASNGQTLIDEPLATVVTAQAGIVAE